MTLQINHHVAFLLSVFILVGFSHLMKMQFMFNGVCELSEQDEVKMVKRSSREAYHWLQETREDK